MKSALSVFLSLILVLPVFADASFSRNLRLGDRGEDVLALQKILNQSADTRIAFSGPGAPGTETDYFGNLTLVAVKKFQTKYRTEVLYPANIFSATGFVGPLTRAKISSLVSDMAGKTEEVGTYGQNNTLPSTVPASLAPSVFVYSVVPNKVRAGEKVTIYGEGFSKTGNKIAIYYGNLSRIFSNLPSEDGKTITFIYQPPHLQTMTETQIRALPYEAVVQLETPIKAAGGTISDALNPYKNFKNEEELASFLARQGKSVDILYDHFYITVENDTGLGYSKTALLWGLRELPFNSTTAKIKSLLLGIKDLIGPLTPRANAQIPGGGFHSGAIMYCTCGAGHLSFAVSLTGGGTGLLYFPPGLVLGAGTGFVASPWIGYVIPMAGQCAITVGVACITIPANLPAGPLWGSML